MTPPLILCVDDDEAILAVVVRCLRRMPIEVRTTTSPSDALAIVATETVAVIVSDYEMPDMNGAQLAAQAKRVRPETVRILLTGRRTFETAVEGINQGEIFRFIAKPFTPDELRTAVADAIVRHNELAALSGDRRRRERREALRAALEQEYPGITEVARAPDGTYSIDADPDVLAAAYGLVLSRG